MGSLVQVACHAVFRVIVHLMDTGIAFVTIVCTVTPDIVVVGGTGSAGIRINTDRIAVGDDVVFDNRCKSAGPMF